MNNDTLSSLMRGIQSHTRQAILDQISKARSEQEISEAEKAADQYLEEHPYDPDVAAAREKLSKRADKRRDPERGTGWWEAVQFFVDGF